MSILIKGMEMPINKPLIVKINPDGSVSSTWENGYKKYTAIPVPPHGDLIDRDTFIEFIRTHWDSYDQWFCDQLEARPTIIEAEEGEA